MPCKPNEIAVIWLELNGAGKINRVNVKHIIGQLAKIMVGAEVVVRFNAKCYRGNVANLLDWAPPQQKKKTSKIQKPVKENNASRKKKAAKVSVYAYLRIAV